MKIYKFLWRKLKFTNFFNPLLPIAYKSARIDKILILKLEGIIKQISYERRDYESVEEKSLSQAMSRKTMKKRIQALKGLRKWKFTNFLNPLLHIAYESARIDKISVLKLEGIIKKFPMSVATMSR